jgi:hypothetical protein
MDPNQLADALSVPLTSGQALKTSGFDHAVDQQTALLQGLQLEQRRAAALHGADSKKAQNIQAFAAAHQQSLSITQTASTTAGTRTPLPNPQEFIIYGFVYNQAGAGSSDIDVSAADDKGTILLTTTSDSDGSYALHIAAQTSGGRTPRGHEHGFIYEIREVVEEVEEVAETAEKLVIGDDRKPDETKPPPTPVMLRLVASDKKKTFMVQSSATFQFQAGKLAYQDLTVPL